MATPTVSVIDAALNAALAHHNAGRLREAEASYRQVLALRADHSLAMHNLGVVALQAGDHDTAIRLLQRSLELEPGSLNYLKNLATAFRTAGRFDESLATITKVLKSTPDDIQARHDLGLTYDKLGRYEQAITEYQRVLKARANNPWGQPNPKADAKTHVNLGAALAKLGRYPEAAVQADKAIALNPDYPLAHINRADALFRLGDLARAWESYEWRWRREDFTQKWPDFPQPVWDGSDFKGKTLLLWHEQGFGDTIHFCRYAPLVAERGGKVIVLCQPELQRFLRSLPSSVEVIASGGEPVAFDLHLPLMSLPRIFGTTLQTIPSPSGYLTAHPELVAKWKDRIDQLPAKSQGARLLRVGLVWSGSPGHRNDRNRSLTLETLSPLAAVPGVQLFSLQKGAAAAQLKESSFGKDVIDWTEELGDFSETAALIQNLDVIVAVDTAVAHVAGSLGKEVWSLLPFEPDFRWLCDKDQSSWYTKMRLFRQPAVGDWAGVAAVVADELRRRVEGSIE